MPMNTNNEQKIKELKDSYRKKIGKTDSNINVSSYSSQYLDEIIKNENAKILNSITLKGYEEEDRTENTLLKYHESEISNNKRINILIIIVVCFGMLLLGTGLIGRIFGFLEDETITILGGLVSETLGFLLKFLQSYSDKNKYKYFESLLNQRQRNKIYHMICFMDEGKDKNQLIAKLVEKDFNILK
ncbi:MAG: hypothetical protein NC489_25865 [Ruminococcus flavefaciens]|nr:hypothetical protein [Ruminococcus flavefaciens]